MCMSLNPWKCFPISIRRCSGCRGAGGWENLLRDRAWWAHCTDHVEYIADCTDSDDPQTIKSMMTSVHLHRTDKNCSGAQKRLTNNGDVQSDSLSRKTRSLQPAQKQTLSVALAELKPLLDLQHQPQGCQHHTSARKNNHLTASTEQRKKKSHSRTQKRITHQNTEQKLFNSLCKKYSHPAVLRKITIARLALKNNIWTANRKKIFNHMNRKKNKCTNEYRRDGEEVAVVGGLARNGRKNKVRWDSRKNSKFLESRCGGKILNLSKYWALQTKRNSPSHSSKIRLFWKQLKKERKTLNS